jgi:hypothetical protein
VILKRYAEAQHPKNLDELKVVLIDVWDNWCLVTAENMVAQMPARMTRVIAEDGYTIHHGDGVDETPQPSTSVILSLSSSPFTNRFAHGILDAKFHALEVNGGLERRDYRANRQLNCHPPPPRSRTHEEHSTKAVALKP